jgi:hypothetical protein
MCSNGISIKVESSVRSMYNALTDIDIISNNPYIWKTKIPLKIKIFLWLFNTRVILTKDNLARKNWKRNKKCCFLI